MDEALRQELLAKSKLALDADDWDAVARLWEPWVQQGDAEAEYQLAHHYLWCWSCDDDATSGQMEQLLRNAAAKDHPDAIWFLASREIRDPETNPEFERILLRAGQLGSVHAQRELGVMYATGWWTGPTDLAEAARWYRLAAEKGHAESQYDLGFMLLLGQGGQKNTEEGLMWLERAGGQGDLGAFRLLVDCYESGICEVPLDAAKAHLWRSRLEEHRRLNPPGPVRRYAIHGAAPSESSLDCLVDIEGVTGFGFGSSQNEIWVFYEPELVTLAQLDERIQATGLSAFPLE
jgi:TPR repeat protein